MHEAQSEKLRQPAQITGPERQLGLASWSFVGLLAAQALGTVNDNMFRWLAIGVGKTMVSPDKVALVLSGGMACFVLPYLLLAAPAGFLADRFAKRQVIIWCKVAEIVLVLAGALALWQRSLAGLGVVLALLGCQSALYSPAKLGGIPEMLRADRIPAANGLMGLVTVAGTVIGAALGNLMADWIVRWGAGWTWTAAATMLGAAIVGCHAALAVRTAGAANPALGFPWNAAWQTWHELRALARSTALFRVALGIAFFWSIGALAQMNVDQFGMEGGLAQRQVTPMLVALVFGLGAGSILAGYWSGGRVELGIVPLGALGIAAAAMLLSTVSGALATADHELTGAFAWACVLLFVLGASAGLFNVPLDSYLQHRSPPESRGAILAASNFMTFGGMLLAAGVYYVLRVPDANNSPLCSARQVFLLAGACTVPVMIYIVWLLPYASLRFVVWLASRTIYRVRVSGRENLPERGGALLAPNHVTFIDGVLLLLTSSRPVRMVAYADHVERPWIRWLARQMGVIPIRPGRRSVVESIRQARAALEAGELVCIFPEGALTRTGELGPFKPGLLAILEGTQAPLIPVYLDGLWGSIFSYEGGRFFWKLPKRWPYPVSIHFGRPLARPERVEEVREAVLKLGAKAMEERNRHELVLPRAFLRMCRRLGRHPKLADSLGTELTARETLLRTCILRRLLRRHVLAADERFVGLLLPPSVGGVLANAALAVDGRVAVNLNYTTSPQVMNACLRQCGIKHVLSSRAFVQKANLQAEALEAEVVYLDDFKDKVTMADKLAAALQAYLLPVRWLESWFGLHRTRPDDLLTVVFTSGSTGEPKGVMLSHANVACNVRAIEQLVRVDRHDVLVGILPFFHSFGYTCTMWTVLALEPKGVYHMSPLDARQVGKLTRRHKGTLLIATPTFLRLYLKSCPSEDFESVEVVMAGAEKLPKELCDAFEQKFGVRPVEGYGTTELSPLVSFNIPPGRALRADALGLKEGSVGRPIPGTQARITDPETGELLGPNQPGMLWIKGPNVMLGYFNRPDLTAAVMQDGWYKTGDIAFIDDDGFITITGRESRFSKIGGEMVPHIKIEETLAAVIGAGEDELRAAVTAVPDPRRGERLVVVHTPLEKPPHQICKELHEAGLPTLWIPSPDSFVQVDQIPILGTGKLDLKALKALAQERLAPAAVQ